MFIHEIETLKRIGSKLKELFHDDIVFIYAFGSRVRGDHGQWSDSDVLIVVKQKNSVLENKIISIFVDEEMKAGFSFIPLIKDYTAFTLEKEHNSPFYNNIIQQGISI